MCSSNIDGLMYMSASMLPCLLVAVCMCCCARRLTRGRNRGQSSVGQKQKKSKIEGIIREAGLLIV